MLLLQAYNSFFTSNNLDVSVCTGRYTLYVLYVDVYGWVINVARRHPFFVRNERVLRTHHLAREVCNFYTLLVDMSSDAEARIGHFNG